MPITTQDRLARLIGPIAIEEAERLAEWLRTAPDAAVDLSACESLHSAVLQVLLAAAPRLAAAPPDPLLAALLSPLPAEVPA